MQHSVRCAHAALPARARRPDLQHGPAVRFRKPGQQPAPARHLGAASAAVRSRKPPDRPSFASKSGGHPALRGLELPAKEPAGVISSSMKNPPGGGPGSSRGAEVGISELADQTNQR